MTRKRCLPDHLSKTTLTAAGVAFRDEAARALSQLDQAIHGAKLGTNGKLGLSRIGFISTAGSEIVPDIYPLPTSWLLCV